MKKYSILTIAVISFFPFLLFAATYSTYEPPRINGSRVDGCALEYGKANCSKWGAEQAAHAFCRKMGHQKATRWSWKHYGDTDIGTFRYKIYRQNGRDKTIWEYCAQCSAAQTKVECVKNSGQNGHPSGYGMKACGCWGANPRPTAPEPRCASGQVRINVCQPNYCGSNHPSYAYVCK